MLLSLIALFFWAHSTALSQESIEPQESAKQLPDTTAPGSIEDFNFFSSQKTAQKNSTNVSETPAITPEEIAKIELCIESLGAGEFAERERVAMELLEIGPKVLPLLRKAAEISDDPEVRFRVVEIATQLTQGDMQARIDDFLDGEDVGFTGWPTVESILGDSPGVRQLFVDLLEEYPDLPESLERATRDRALELEKAIAKVQRRLLVERKMPTSADAFALLLPSADPMVPTNKGLEDLLLSILQRETATKIRKDAQLSGPFEMLLSHWIPRSSLSSREEVLLMGMDWDLSRATLGLAMQTLQEATNTETLAIALQAIAKFGDPRKTEFIQPMLDDPRKVVDGGFSDDGALETQLGDVAMATIARLNNVNLETIGFTGAKQHPAFEFVLTEIGFPKKNEEKRAAVRKEIEKILEARKQRNTPPRPQ